MAGMGRRLTLAARVALSLLVATSAEAQGPHRSSPMDESRPNGASEEEHVVLSADAPASAPYSGPPATLHFEPDTPNVVLSRKTGRASSVQVYEFRAGTYYESEVHYAPICKGPCVMEIAPGTYDLALSKVDGDLVKVGTETLAGPLTLRTEYRDWTALRYTGMAIGIAGALGGVALIVLGTDADGPDWTFLGPGFATLLSTATVGLILGLMPDAARLHVTPFVLAQPAPVAGAAVRPPGATSPPQGAALTLSF